MQWEMPAYILSYAVHTDRGFTASDSCLRVQVKRDLRFQVTNLMSDIPAFGVWDLEP